MMSRPARRSLVVLLAISVVVACDRPEEPPRVAPLTTAKPAPSGSSTSAPAGLSAPRREPERELSPVRGEALGVHYIEIVTGGAAPTSELPLVLAIHGLGDRPEAYATALVGFEPPARFVFPRGLYDYHGGYSWFNLAGALDSEETSRGVVAAASKLAAVLGELAKTKPTRGKPIVTGFSQGGALSFAIAALHPDVVGAAFPVGGWVAFSTPTIAGPRAALPSIFALHGEADTRVPIELSRGSVAKLNAAGIPAELRVFPGVGHAMPPVVRGELHSLIAAASSAITP